MRKRGWTIKELNIAVGKSKSIRQVISKLGLVEAGGNYEQIKREIKSNNISTKHFTGKGWRKGLTIPTVPVISLKKILVKNSSFQSHKLKKRLFLEKIKKQKCEICGWNKQSIDGRIPVELDHINGNRYDNRLENLRILCPNCHSLQPTHRGLNKRKCPSGVIGSRRRLKISRP